MKKALFLVLIALLISLASVGFAASPSFAEIITENKTINVPTDFADINAALDYLSDKRIAANAIVTIQVANGNFTYTKTIEIKHADGDKINIIGNINSPENCVLNFASSCKFAISLDNGQRLGLINGFRLNGHNTLSKADGTRYGIHARYNSCVKCGPQIIVANFVYGIEAETQAIISAKGVTAQSCEWGFLAHTHASIIAPEAIGINNKVHMEAAGNSFISAKKAAFSGGTVNVRSDDHSWIEYDEPVKDPRICSMNLKSELKVSGDVNHPTKSLRYSWDAKMDSTLPCTLRIRHEYYNYDDPDTPEKTFYTDWVNMEGEVEHGTKGEYSAAGNYLKKIRLVLEKIDNGAIREIDDKQWDNLEKVIQQ